MIFQNCFFRMGTRKVVAISIVVCIVDCDFVTAYCQSIINMLSFNMSSLPWIQQTQVGYEAQHHWQLY